MASAMPDIRLPSQPQGLTARWLASNYTFILPLRTLLSSTLKVVSVVNVNNDVSIHTVRCVHRRVKWANFELLSYEFPFMSTDRCTINDGVTNNTTGFFNWNTMYICWWHACCRSFMSIFWLSIFEKNSSTACQKTKCVEIPKKIYTNFITK